jgi:hypothetical protein
MEVWLGAPRGTPQCDRLGGGVTGMMRCPQLLLQQNKLRAHLLHMLLLQLAMLCSAPHLPDVSQQ